MPATRKACARCACVIEECARRGVGALTLFAFSSENWQRPTIEVSSLMQLFLDAIDREVEDLHKNKVRLRFIGDRHALSVKLQARMAAPTHLRRAKRSPRNSGSSCRWR